MKALPAGDRFRFAKDAVSPTTFGAGAVCRLVDRGETDGAPGSDPLLREELRALLPRVPLALDELEFAGGAVGFITYERGAGIEGLAPRALRRAGPDLAFAVYDTFARFDPAAREIEVVSWGLGPDGAFDERLALQRAKDLEEQLRAAKKGEDVSSPPLSAIASPSSAPRLSLDRASHARAVASILDSIRRGDLYQANLTARFDAAFAGDPLEFFERLLRDNPSPYSAFLEVEGLVIVSSSPERLLGVRGRDVESRPIKGTAPRSPDPRQDRSNADALLESTKDRAELLMITDLVRNDLGKVCEYGSIEVPHLRALESYAHVHHLVSTVRGRLRPDADPLDALHALFPYGSITGTPKRRAMEKLAELEPAPRDVYTGTIGWIGFDRRAHFSVAIRTGLLADGILTYGAGGGIVADSDADLEWEELLVKAKAFNEALSPASARVDGKSKEAVS